MITQAVFHVWILLSIRKHQTSLLVDWINDIFLFIMNSSFWIILRRSSLDSNLQVSQGTEGTGQDELETLLSAGELSVWVRAGHGPGLFVRHGVTDVKKGHQRHFTIGIRLPTASPGGPHHKLWGHRLLNRDKHRDIIEASLCWPDIQDNIWLILVSLVSG